MSDLQNLEQFAKSLEGKDLRGLRSELYRLKRAVRDARKGVESGREKRNSAWNKRTELWRRQAEEVKAAMGRLGTPYEATALEQEAETFRRKIPEIQRIEFSLNAFFSGMYSWTFDLTRNPVRVHCRIQLLNRSVRMSSCDYELDRGYLRSQLLQIHMGEWRRTYSPEQFGHVMTDGAAWNLEISYGPGKKIFRVRGSNAYPWNFEDWERLLRLPPDTKRESTFLKGQKESQNWEQSGNEV